MARSARSVYRGGIVLVLFFCVIGRGLASLDQAAGRAVWRFVNRDQERRDKTNRVHNILFPRDRTLVRSAKSMGSSRQNNQNNQDYSHPISQWPDRPQCHADLMMDSRAWDTSSPQCEDTAGEPTTEPGYWRAFDRLVNEVQFVGKACRGDAFRIPEHMPGDSARSTLRTIALPSRGQCACSEPTPRNMQRAREFDDRNYARGQLDCSGDLSLKDMISEDGPAVRKQIRHLVSVVRNVIRNAKNCNNN